MRILISNDDGYNSLGIKELAKQLSKNHSVVIFAPDSNKSASSSSLTINSTLKPIKVADNIYKVSATPSDCVHLALRGYFASKFDIVVTGINLGANMGDDVIYSGTVAGAIEARHLGLPAIAFSLATNIVTPYNINNENNYNFATAGIIATQILDKIQQNNFSSGTILNVNVPDILPKQIKGLQTTRLGKRHQASKIRVCSDDNSCFYLGENGSEDDNGIGTDFYAINNGFISVTPLHIDLTRYSEMDNVANWLGEK